MSDTYTYEIIILYSIYYCETHAENEKKDAYIRYLKPMR